jgi:hypothetical protein
LVYREGNATLNTRGCPQRDPFCPQDPTYDRFAPTKQNLLCDGASSIETILDSPDFKPEQPQVSYEPIPANETSAAAATTTAAASSSSEEDVATPTYYPVTDVTEPSTPNRRRREIESTPTETTTTATTTTASATTDFVPATQKIARDPVFNYVVPRTSRYVLLLDRSSSMGQNGRWTTIQRALYRFVSYIPVGSELSIITFGKAADINLPPTVVTDTNREGLHGRIPRKVLENDDTSCSYCALNTSLVSKLQNFFSSSSLTFEQSKLARLSLAKLSSLVKYLQVRSEPTFQRFPSG